MIRLGIDHMSPQNMLSGQKEGMFSLRFSIMTNMFIIIEYMNIANRIVCSWDGGYPFDE